MVVDVFPYTADNNGNIVNLLVDIMRVPSGSLVHGEYITVILSIPGRSHKFSSSRVGSEPIDKSIYKLYISTSRDDL